VSPSLPTFWNSFFLDFTKFKVFVLDPTNEARNAVLQTLLSLSIQTFYTFEALNPCLVVAVPFQFPGAILRH
jgi:hypothetical protein